MRAFPSLYSFDAFGLQGPCMFAFYCIDFAFVKVNYIINLSDAFWFDSWSVTKKDAFTTLSIFKLFKDETFAPSAVFLLDNTSSGLINDQVAKSSQKKKKKKFYFSWNQLIVIIILQWWLQELMGGLKEDLLESCANTSMSNWVWSFHVLHLALC